jgi:hypothetical protein
LFLELFVFHHPPGRQEITPRKTNDVGGPRHVCLRVTNIAEVFAHVKSLDGVHSGRVDTPMHADHRALLLEQGYVL